MSAEHLQAPDAPGFKLDRPRGGRLRSLRGRLLARRQRAQCLGADAWGSPPACLLSTAATVAMNHWNRWFFDSLEKRDVAAVTSSVAVFALIIAAMAAIGVWHRADARDLAGALARLDRRAAAGALARQPALLSPQRHRQGAAQPRVPHLRRHPLGHRAAGRSRHRPVVGRGRRGGVHLHPVERRRLADARPGRPARRSRFPPTWCGWRWPMASSPPG